MEEQLKGYISSELYKKYSIYKENLSEIKKIRLKIDNKIKILDNMLRMVKKPNDIYKPSVNNFYAKYVCKILDDGIKGLDSDEAEHLANTVIIIDGSKKDDAINVLETIKYFKNHLIKEKSSYDYSQYEKKINSYKHVLMSIKYDTYYKDPIKVQELKDILKEENLDDNYELRSYIDTKHLNYLDEIDKKSKKQNEAKDKKSVKPCCKENKSVKLNKNKYVFDPDLLFDDDDIILQQNVRELIFNNKSQIDFINTSSYNYISDITKLSDEEIINLNLLEAKKINRFRIYDTLIRLKNLLDELDLLISDIIGKKLSKEKIASLIPYKDDIMFKINDLYDYYQSFSGLACNNKHDNKRHIIYLSSSNGKTYFENDIIDSSIAEEYYPSFIKLIKDIENGIITSNPLKDGKYTNNNKLKDVLKKKNFSSRIIYKIEGDVAFIITGFIKKNDKARFESELLKRYSLSANKQIEDMLVLMQDKDEKAKLIEEHSIINTQILNKLKVNARGGKKLIKL